MSEIFVPHPTREPIASESGASEFSAREFVAARAALHETRRADARRRWLWVRVPAIFTAVMGVLNVWSAVTPGLRHRMKILWDILPFEAGRGSHLAAALAGFALLIFSVSLWRRKQVAWALTLAALLISSIAHLLKGLDFEEALVALALACWLWLGRREFHARSDKPSMRHGIRVLALAFAFTLAYGTLGFYLLDEHFKIQFGLSAALVQTVTMFTRFYNPKLEPITGFGRDFADSIYIVGASTLGYALMMLARPVVMRRTQASSAQRARALKIVDAHGRTALAFCALLPDKLYWFSKGGSVLSYALVGRVAVALGDPIGPREDARNSIRGFVEFCHRNDWRPAFYEIYDENLDEYRAADLETLRIAHEAVVDVQSFVLEGKSFKNIRNAINSLTKAGYRVQLHHPPLAPGVLVQLREVSDDWLSTMNGEEKQFSLGWFEDDYIRACPVMAIHDASDDIVAFANIVSCYNLPEGNIDLMRRRPNVPKGTMEWLFVSLFAWAKAQGFQTFNLGPSPFAMVGEHSQDPATEKAMHFLYEHVNQFYNFKGLHTFKEKFHPQWRAVYLAYGGKAGLPLVAAAIIRADAGADSWWDFTKRLRSSRSAESRSPENDSDATRGHQLGQEPAPIMSENGARDGRASA